jgi:hypothetical protein
MPFRRRKQPTTPRKKPGILPWPGTAYFVMTVLAGAIVARLLEMSGHL